MKLFIVCILLLASSLAVAQVDVSAATQGVSDGRDAVVSLVVALMAVAAVVLSMRLVLRELKRDNRTYRGL